MGQAQAEEGRRQAAHGRERREQAAALLRLREAKGHDSKKESELFDSLKVGDIGIADRAYNHFKTLYEQSVRGVFFVVREKSRMKMRVVSKVAEKDFYGENEQAVEWQIWAALLTHLVLRYLKYKSKAQCSYSRFAALVRAIVWLKKDAMEILRAYGIAPVPKSGGVTSGMPYLPGFEKAFLKAM